MKNPEEIIALAAKISDAPTRKVIQQLVISGNIEANNADDWSGSKRIDER